jgi:hypothetical protein
MLEELSLEELKALSEHILEKIADREWDRLLATPESDAYLEKLEKRTKSDIVAGRVREYIPGKSIEELFQG